MRERATRRAIAYKSTVGTRPSSPDQKAIQPAQSNKNNKDGVQMGQRKTKNAPPDAVARSQRIPTLLPEEEPREFGRDEVVYGCESDRGDEQRVEVVW